MSDSRPTRVVVSDVNMPFWSMVSFMVKWSIASIPAIVILAVVGFLTLAVLSRLSAP